LELSRDILKNLKDTSRRCKCLRKLNMIAGIPVRGYFCNGYEQEVSLQN